MQTKCKYEYFSSICKCLESVSVHIKRKWFGSKSKSKTTIKLYLKQVDFYLFKAKYEEHQVIYMVNLLCVFWPNTWIKFILYFIPLKRSTILFVDASTLYFNLYFCDFISFIRTIKSDTLERFDNGIYNLPFNSPILCEEIIFDFSYLILTQWFCMCI